MASKHPRLQVVLEKPLYEAVAVLARQDDTSMSLKARDLIREALEHLEDVGLSLVVKERAKHPRFISLERLERRLARAK